MNQELANQLIAWYEAALLQIKKKWFLWTALKVAIDLYVDNGVCYCADRIFEADIINDEFVRRNCTRISREQYSPYWCRPVFDARSKHEVIELLQKRIDILKTYKQP